WSCKTAGGTPTTSTGWTSSLGAWNYSNASQNCTGGGPLQLDATPQMNVPTNQPGMLWQYQAPPNTTISTASLLWAGQQSGSDYSATVGITVNRDSTAYDGDHVLDNCQWFAGCAGEPLATRTYNVNADRLLVGIGCGGSDGASCQGGDRAHVQIYSAGIDLVDNSAPQVGTMSGSLFANRSLQGNESLIVPVSDVGVGVADIAVSIDGTPAINRQPVDTNGNLCVPIEGGYRAPVPCKLNVTANLSVPTNVVADGQHTITGTVWDAAGNATPFLSQKVTIDNVPPPAIKPSTATATNVPNPNAPRIDGDASVGALLTAFDGNWTDATAQLTRTWQVADSATGPWTDIPAAVGPTYRPNALQAGKYLRITVTAVTKEGTTAASSDARLVSQSQAGSLALTSLSANNGTGGNPATGKLVPSSKRTKATVNFKKTVHVAGKLVDATGTPIAGGQIDVFETIAPSGTRTKVGTITTDSKGRYSWSPATRSNRVEELAYSRQSGSDNYQSTQSLQVFVRAGVTIKLQRKHIPSHGKGIITGRVLVDGFPASGVRVEVFAIGTHGNQSGGTVRTNGTGHFKWSYRYTRVAHGAVALFVKVHRDPDMPALDGRSNIVRQRIG
ncbi:MAG: hypothetical protein AAGC46_09960, partial [Solirubrobacteraceae bacterium]|nr:hypothetical protein [Patulibacter sp.]